MSSNSGYMGLIQWGPNDYFNDQELRDNWNAIEGHDHTEGKGTPIKEGGLASNAVTADNIKDSSVTTTKIADRSITITKLQLDLQNALADARKALSQSTFFSGDVSGTFQDLQLGSGVVTNENVSSTSKINPDKLNIKTYSTQDLSTDNPVIDKAGFASMLGTQSAFATASGTNLGESNNKIVDTAYSIPRTKLKSSIGNNSVPVVVTYGESLPSVGLQTGDEIYYYATSDGKSIWHLRYNGTNWDFLGGSPILLNGVTTASATTTGDPNTGTGLVAKGLNISYWPSDGTLGGGVRTIDSGVSLNNVQLPLAGTYIASYSATIGQFNSSNSITNGNITTGIGFAAAAPDLTVANWVTTPASHSAAYTSINKFAASGYSIVTATMPFYKFTQTDSSKKYIRQYVGIGSTNSESENTQDLKIGTSVVNSSSSDALFTLYDRTLTITPVSLSNWS